jgi:hypothetical protein
VGELTLSGTTTSGPPIARIGNKTITGGAILAGGTKVVLRTYTDALEWDVKNGDVLGALKGKPRTTGLPDEKQGEAITYSADGKNFLTVSDMSGDDKTANYILSYTPATKVATAAKGTEVGGGKKWYDGLSIGDIKTALGGIGVLGLILVGVGVFGITQFRKKQRSMPEPAPDGFETPLKNRDPETELIGVGGSAPRTAGVYGGVGAAGAGAAAAGAARSGPVYGSGGPGAAAGQRGGGAPVYGGANGQQPARGGGAGPQAPARGGGVGPQAPARGPQGQQPARGGGAGPQAPARGPQGQQPGRGGGAGPQAPARGPQGQPPARGPQGQPPRGPQGQLARGPQGQPARGPQGQPPARGPQGQPARAPQPPRGPQGQPPARGPQGQPPRGPQGQQPPRSPEGQPPRGPQGQPGRGGEGGRGVYGQGPRGDGYSDYNPRREDRYDPGYGRR